MARAWYPLATRTVYERPNPGDLIARDHAVWQIEKVTDLPLSDRDREVWLESGMPDLDGWKGRPYRIDVVHVGGARPDWAPPDLERLTAKMRIPAVRFGGPTWEVYPTGRWPRCSCCGEPMPCRAELQDREVAAGLAEVEKLAKRMPGCCWACGEPITSRQKTVDYPGDNLDLPGGPPVRFHTRAKCRWDAQRYELQWIAQDPRRERILTYPKCGGILVVHADGSSECAAGRSGMTGQEFAGEPGCGGHLTHDHGAHAACYVGDGWFSRVDGGGCPRGCSPVGHPGTRTTRRPERRQHEGHLLG